MKRLSKKLIAVLSVGIAVAGTPVGYTGAMTTPQAGVTTNVSVDVSTNAGGVLWENEVVYAVGHGRQPNINEQGADDLARQAAIMDAYRHLVGAVQGVQVDAESVMEMLMLKQDTVRNKIAGVVRGASIVDEGKLPNGSYYVKMVAPLYGVNSVAAAALPEVMPKQPVPPPAVTAPVITQVEIQEVKSVRYTGVIVDAGGLGLMPAMSPVIYDTNGRAVYGASNIDVNFAIGHGMVGYSKSVSDANSNSRIGTNALVVKAVSVKGGSNSTNPVNVVISPEDADRILLSNQDGGYLQKGAVLFVR